MEISTVLRPTSYESSPDFRMPITSQLSVFSFNCGIPLSETPVQDMVNFDPTLLSIKEAGNSSENL